MESSTQKSKDRLEIIDPKNVSPNFLTNITTWNSHILNTIIILIHYLNYKIETLNSKLQKRNLCQNNELYKLIDLFSQSHTFLWLKNRIYGQQRKTYYFNIPYIFSILILDLTESFRKKTVFLYQTVLIFSLPVLLYRINNQIHFGQHKNYLPYIILGKTPIISLKDKLYHEETSQPQWLYVKKLQQTLNNIICSNKLLANKNIRESFTISPVFREKESKKNTITYEKDKEIGQKNLLLYKEKSKKIYNKKNFSFNQKNLENKRILEMLKNIHLGKTYTKLKLTPIVNDEWEIIDTSVSYKEEIPWKKLQERRNSTFKENTSIHYLKTKSSNNFQSLLNHCYLFFIKPKNFQRRVLNYVDLQNDSLDHKEELQYTGNYKTTKEYENVKKYIQNNHEIEKKKNKDKEKFVKIYDYKKDLEKTNVIILYKKIHRHTFFNLLDFQRKIWRWKTIEWINLYKKNNNINSQEKNSKIWNNSFFKKKNIKNLIKSYWIWNQRKIFNPLINIILFTNTNHIGDEISCWHSIDYKIVKKHKQVLIEKSNDQQYGYLPDELKDYYSCQDYNIDKKESVINEINLLNIAKQLHFAPAQNVIEPFVKTEYKGDFNNKIVYKNIINHTFGNRHIINDIKENQIYDTNIDIVSEKIKATVHKDGILQWNKEYQGLFDIQNYLLKFLLKNSDSSLTFHQNFSYWFRNWHVNREYIKNRYRDNKLKNSNTIDIQYKNIFPATIEEKKNKQITNLNKNLSFFSVHPEKNMFIDFSKIHKTTHDPFLWLPFSLLEHKKTDIEGSMNTTNNSLLLLGIDSKNNKSKTLAGLNNFQENYKEFEEKTGKIFKNNVNHQLNMIKKYNSWIFTQQWWTFRKKILLNDIPILRQHGIDTRRAFLQPKINKMLLRYQNEAKKIYAKIHLDANKNLLERLQNWNEYILEEIYKLQKKFVPMWENVNGYQALHANEWALIGWFTTLCIIYYHWLPMYTGITYLDGWRKFEKMRSFSHPSWNTFLYILVHNSIESSSQQVRLTMYASRGWIIWLQSKIFSYLLGKTFLSNWLLNTISQDLPRSKKNLVVNSLITQKTLLSKYSLSDTNRLINQNHLSFRQDKAYDGFTYLEKWSHTYYRDPNLMQYNKSLSNQFQWLTDLFFHIKSSPIKSQLELDHFSLVDKRKIPKNLPEPILSSKRWLLIGAPETGKSYLVKNLAAEAHLPLVHISLKDIRHATPDFKYNKLKQDTQLIEQLADRGFLVENILELAKMLAPCILWISDLHEFHAKHNSHNQPGKIYDASLLLTILLKIMGNDLLPERQSNITLVGSSHNPGLLDPKFVSRHRLDLIINLRKLSFGQRQKIFANLLNKKKLYIQGKRSFYELGSNSIGYNLRDIAGLVNEMLLIKTTNRTNVIDTNIIRLAVYRQISKQSANNRILEHQSLQYKIGKAIVQSTLVAPKPIFPLTIRHDLWKTRFYYLSNAFLEFALEKSTVTEFTILTHIVNCLAGSAARDAWISYKRNSPTKSIYLNKQLKHDLSIASSILQSLLLEFPMQDINSFPCVNKYDLLSNFRGKYKINLFEKAASSLKFFNRFTSYIYWSYRIQRLSLSWNLFFDNIKKKRKNIILESSSDDIQNNIDTKILDDDLEQHLPYERRVIKRQEKRTKKIHYSFNEMVLDSNLKNMGLPWVSEYVIDYDALQLSILLLEARPIWNPPALTPAYSILFFDRDLLISRNILTKLYITYGEKFQSEKLNPKRIKKQILWPDAKIHNSNINEKSAKQEEKFDGDLQDFHYFRKMAKANAQLEQSQLQAPIYLYQGWTSTDYEDNWRSCDLLHHRDTLVNEKLQSRELLIYGILLEIYHSLLKFFISNYSLLSNIEFALIKKGTLNREDIERTVNIGKFW